MDLLHNLTPSVSRSSPPPPAFRQATMPVSVAPGQVAPFTCGCQWKLLLFSLYFSFLFSTCYLAFYVALQRFATPHSAQQHAACRPVICSCRRNFSLPTFRGVASFRTLIVQHGENFGCLLPNWMRLAAQCPCQQAERDREREGAL